MADAATAQRERITSDIAELRRLVVAVRARQYGGTWELAHRAELLADEAEAWLRLDLPELADRALFPYRVNCAVEELWP